MRPIASRYDAMAEFYAGIIGDDLADPASRALLELVGDVHGRRVLDAACGHGRIARELARRGASVIGVDASPALLDQARAADDPAHSVEYVLGDVSDSATLAGELFAVVTCHFALSDIDDLEGTLATVKRVTKPGGVFVFSMLHPCFPGWGADAPSSWPADGGYYREGWWLADNPGLRGRVGANHRMLSTYLNLLAAHQLGIETTVEPQPGADWASRNPGAMPVPVFFVARCRRGWTSAVR